MWGCARVVMGWREKKGPRKEGALPMTSKLKGGRHTTIGSLAFAYPLLLLVPSMSPPFRSGGGEYVVGTVDGTAPEVTSQDSSNEPAHPGTKRNKEEADHRSQLGAWRR